MGPRKVFPKPGLWTPYCRKQNEIAALIDEYYGMRFSVIVFRKD